MKVLYRFLYGSRCSKGHYEGYIRDLPQRRSTITVRGEVLGTRI